MEYRRITPDYIFSYAKVFENEGIGYDEAGFFLSVADVTGIDVSPAASLACLLICFTCNQKEVPWTSTG